MFIFLGGFSFARPLPPNAPNLENKVIFVCSSCLLVGLVGLLQQNPKQKPNKSTNEDNTQNKN